MDNNSLKIDDQNVIKQAGSAAARTLNNQQTPSVSQALNSQTNNNPNDHLNQAISNDQTNQFISQNVGSSANNQAAPIVNPQAIQNTNLENLNKPSYLSESQTSSVVNSTLNQPAISPGIPSQTIGAVFYNDPIAGEGSAVKLNGSKGKISKKKLTIIIGLILFVLAILGAVLFYFAYWTRSDVVYSRAQKQFAKILTSTLNSEVKLVNDTEMSLEVNFESKTPFTGKLKTRLLESGSSTNVDLVYKDANLKLDFITKNDSNGEVGQYIKYQNLKQMVDILLNPSGNANRQTLVNSSVYNSYVNTLNKYDNKWIALNITELLSQKDNANNEAVTQEDIRQVMNKFIPIINDRYIG